MSQGNLVRMHLDKNTFLLFNTKFEKISLECALWYIGNAVQRGCVN